MAFECSDGPARFFYQPDRETQAAQVTCQRQAGWAGTDDQHVDPVVGVCHELIHIVKTSHNLGEPLKY